MMSTLATILPAMLGDATGPTFWMPEAASSVAGEVDWILEFINIISYVFFGIIVFALVYLAVKYRRDPNRKQISGDGPTHNMALELTWTIIPTLIVLVIFWVGMVGYIDLRESPDDSYEVGVFAQKWQWTFSHPEYGVTEGGELTVPLGRPVRVIMTSADVLHAFFVPAFRVKQDIVPGRYSTLWFEATKPGSYQLYCAEYCGKDHSKMLATVRVLPEDEFQDTMGKLAREYEDLPDADLPRYALVRLYNRCSSCHSLDGSTGTAPSFKGLWDRTTGGSTVFTDGSSLKDHMGSGGEYEVPENYIRESILNPGKYVVENFTNVMPNNFASQLKPRQIEALILMMKHMDELVDEDGNIIEPPETEEPKASAMTETTGDGG